jgi:hypothetical protein
MAILTGGLVAIIGKVLTIYSISGIGNFLILVAFVLNGLILFPGGKWIVNSKIRSETEK